MLSLLAGVPNLRQDHPTKRECALCDRMAFGLPGARDNKRLRQEDLDYGIHIFLLVVWWVAWRPAPRALCLPHLNYRGGLVCRGLLLAPGTRGLVEYPLKASEVGEGLSMRQSFWGAGRGERRRNVSPSLRVANSQISTSTV